MARRLRVLLALEGGGAKGIVHVGALKALESTEEYDVEFVGLAGTSAGAIIAALKAAGYRADELIDPLARRTVLDDLKGADLNMNFAGRLDASCFFEQHEWRRLLELRSWSVPRFIIAVFCSIYVVLVVFYLAHLAWSCSPAAGIAVALVICGLLALGLYQLWCGLLGGRAQLDRFRDVLDLLLKRKLDSIPAGEPVRFSDFGEGTRRPALKIVAADISARRLRLFSPETTPQVAVADAVCASICLPIVFGPREIAGVDPANGAVPHLFLDGGLVSNLPTWPFDVERALDPTSLTIAVEIADDPLHGRVMRTNWLGSALRTAIFGSAPLNKRAIGRLEVIRLSAKDIGVLEFDIAADRAFGAVEAATTFSRATINQRLFQPAALLEKANTEIKKLVEGAFTQAELWCDGRTVRVAIAKPESPEVLEEQGGRVRYLTLRHEVGFDHNDMPDEGMILPIGSTRAGEAWESCRAQLLFTAGRHEVVGQSRNFDGEANLQRRKRIWQKQAWVLSVPIKHLVRDGYPDFVVCIDSDLVLDAELSYIATVMEQIVSETERIMIDVLRKLHEG